MLGLISAESDPSLGRLFSEGTLFTTLKWRIDDKHPLRPDFQRLVAARFRGGWAALDNAALHGGQVDPVGQPDGTFSLGQLSPDLAAIDVHAELAGDQYPAVAAALAALSDAEVFRLGEALVGLPLAQRSLATSVLTRIHAALGAQASHADVPESTAVNRLDRLITPLRRATVGQFAGLGSPGDVQLFPPAALLSQASPEPGSEEMAPVRLRFTPPASTGTGRGQAPRGAGEQRTRPPGTSSDPEQDTRRLVAEMNFRATYPAGAHDLTDDEFRAAREAVLEAGRKILTRPADEPPPQAVVDWLAEQERLGLVLTAAEQRLQQLYIDYREAVEQATPLTGLTEMAAAAAQARNHAAASRAAYVGVLAELPAALASVRSGELAVPPGDIGTALEAIRQQAEQAAGQASTDHLDAVATQAFDDAVQAGLKGIDGHVNELARIGASGAFLTRAADLLPAEFRPAAGHGGDPASTGAVDGDPVGNETEAAWEQGPDGKFHMVRRPVKPGSPPGQANGQASTSKAGSSPASLRGPDGASRPSGGPSGFRLQPGRFPRLAGNKRHRDGHQALSRGQRYDGPGVRRGRGRGRAAGHEPDRPRAGDQRGHCREDNAGRARGPPAQARPHRQRGGAAPDG